MWHVDYIPADFTSVVIGLRAARDCKETRQLVDKGREILRQLRRRKVRLPSTEVMDRWQRSLRSFKKYCRRK